MGWAKIKKAINSTLGTSEFKPLDEIIKGQKSLLVSDNLYYSFPTLTFENVTSGENNRVVKDVMKFKCPGSCRIEIGSFSLDATSTSQVNAIVYINGINRCSLWGSTLSTELTFNEGDILSIGLSQIINGEKYTATVNNMKIYADIVDNSAIELL